MENQQVDPNPQNTTLTPSADFRKDFESLSSIARILNSIANYPNTLRREFRGEMMYETEEGDIHWVQGTKPIFVKMDFNTGSPLKETKKMPWGEDKEIYVPNDEAIEEVLSMIKFVGVNQINPIGFNTPENYLDDLLEFECKLSALLASKQPEWGIDKEMLPMLQMKIKTLVQDVRSLSVKGNLLKSMQTMIQRVEQFVENENNKKRWDPKTY